jgi:predicted nucleotidyltransferase component of viral defense system
MSNSTLYHEDSDRMRAALEFAQAVNGFSSRLIEKDYYCSLLLHDFAAPFASGLVFKGGTCLSKVHTEFFRLSEDLDFGFSLDAETPRSQRRKAVHPFKGHFAGIPARLPCFQIVDALRGSNDSAQYNGRLSYRSIVTGENESIKVEISLREPVLVAPPLQVARTMLLDPSTGRATLPQVMVQAISFDEAYAEKMRAALTRDDPAIRDFFDIDSAVYQRWLNHRDAQILGLLKQKLGVPGNPAIDLSPQKVADLLDQIEGQLRPVLRAKDFDAFDLNRAVNLLTEVVALVQSAS